jgi:hypothetical protein
MVGSLFGKGLGKREARQRAEDLCQFLGVSGFTGDINRMTALEIKKMGTALNQSCSFWMR